MKNDKNVILGWSIPVISVPFQIIPIPLSLPQVNFTQSVVTSISNMLFLLYHYGVD